MFSFYSNYLVILTFFFNFKSLSIIIKSGLWLSKPLILQLSNELSLLIDLAVEIIQLYCDLIKCATFLDLLFVIH